jgi:rubrerythrin
VTQAAPITELRDLLAIAWQIEADAVERYTVLADQMETHNNPDLVAVFRDLARAETIHRDEIRQQAGDIDAAEAARLRARLFRGETPEEAEMGAAHYMMTPWHALQMALAGEKQALAFFQQVVATATDAKIREMAEEFVEEEAEHVNLVNRLLRKYPPPSGEWSDDPDPPVAQE